MPTYKDPQNKLHFLDEARHAYLLPAGCVVITEVEASAIRNAPKTPAEIAAETSAAALRELAAIDAASIRSMREWIAAQPTAPQILKDREAAAVLARAKL